MRLQLSRLDALLVLMTIIWGANYSVVKAALHDTPAIAFNTVRLMLASALFLTAIGVSSRRRTGTGLLRLVCRSARRPVSDETLPSGVSGPAATPAAARPLGRDRFGIVALGVAHFVYQLLFITALARTSAANSSLIIGCTPVFIAAMTAVLGQERIAAIRWAGIVLSALGIYLVVGHGAAVTPQSLGGDFMMLGAVLCWSAATVGARSLLARHPPLIVTGLGMAVGTALYIPVGWHELRHLPAGAMSPATWMALVFSATFALFIAYLIWFTAVQRLGNTRTSVYSNMVPLVGMLAAWVGLGETIGSMKIAGAAAILVGVALTRIQAHEPPVAEPA